MTEKPEKAVEAAAQRVNSDIKIVAEAAGKLSVLIDFPAEGENPEAAKVRGNTCAQFEDRVAKVEGNTVERGVDMRFLAQHNPGLSTKTFDDAVIAENDAVKDGLGIHAKKCVPPKPTN